jgi:hypothetical protein
MPTAKTIIVQDLPITILNVQNQDYISLTDMLKEKRRGFFHF